MPDYKDTDFVYVDPKTREVKGLVEWTADGNAKPLLMVFKEGPAVKSSDKEDAKPKRIIKNINRYYPWGSYKTMKKLYKLEGKGKEKESDKNQSLDEAMGKAAKEPFWD
ncbi:hypothetical protein KKF55_05210 [Patescibacteria group bacterium]|nr:hypothetical protein [Patescibacteria group bacterium]